MQNTLKKFILTLCLSLSAFSTFASESEISTRIIGGSDATDDELPSIVSLTYNGNFFCAGSLIHADWVVTAAHCLYHTDGSLLKIEKLILTVSDYDLNEQKEYSHISKMIIHPSYDHDYVNNDIALLKLTDSSITPPIKVESIDPDNRTENAFIWGWGVRHSSHKLPSDILQKGTISVFSNFECFNQIPTHFIGRTMLCGGNNAGTVDSCSGDSGGPIIVRGNLVGITSWGGTDCADKKHPGVYTRISEYQPWITSIITNQPIIEDNDNSDSNGLALNFSLLLLIPLIFIRRKYTIKIKNTKELL